MGNILLNLGEFIQSEKTAAICCRFVAPVLLKTNLYYAFRQQYR